MKIGFVGLGRMGANMVERILKSGHEVVAFDLSEKARKDVKKKGAQVVDSLEGLAKSLKSPKAIWVMVPAGAPTEDTIMKLSENMEKGDIIIDGGNSNYRDSMRRAKVLEAKGLGFLDAGTSGGIWGLKIGYCLMIGGKEDVFNKVEPIFAALAPEEGYELVGPSGAGHFVKMVHNGIEYALLQAYGEGFEVMEQKRIFDLDLAKIAKLWNHGSVVRSWLLELSESAFKKDTHLEGIEGYVEDSGEGRWTVAEAINEDVPAPIITLSLLERLRSRQRESFSAKVIASLRNEFGGHSVKTN